MSESDDLHARYGALAAEAEALRGRVTRAEQREGTERAKVDRLTSLLAEAKDQIVSLRDEADRLASPPAGFGILVEAVRENGDLPALADVFTGGRKVRCTLSSQLDPDDLQPGREVLVNESMNVVAVLGHD